MAVGPDGRFELGIGDPTPIGWIAVLAYAAAMWLAWRNAGAARRTATPASFWLGLALLMVLLGLNKQLDLQSWFGQTGRDMAIEQGWYEHRRIVQGLFIALLVAAAVAFVVAARAQWALLWTEYRVAFIGVVVLLAFIVIRAASFHHVDTMLKIDLGVTELHRALEIVGVLIVVYGCAQWHRMHRLRVQRFVVQRVKRGGR